VAEKFEDRLVIPTTPTGLAQIELKVSSLLDKLNAMQVEPILDGMDENMQQSESLLREVRELTASIKEMLNNPEIQQVPANINQTLSELRKAIEGLSPESQTYQELNKTLQSLDTLLRDLQPLARTLGEQPNALIFNPPAEDDPQPPAARP
jgi:paraquat-inducible protein B